MKVTAADYAEIERLVCERSLYEFLRRAWPNFDPHPFVDGWHLQAICWHLQAVTRGEIKRLLINIPPRFGKTGSVTIAWPCWTWALPPEEGNLRRGAQTTFLCASYGADKAQKDALKARRLLDSGWYQRLWGDRVCITRDMDSREQYDTTAGGWRINTGIPESLGKGGIIKILDDPHKTNEIESDLVRGKVIENYREIWASRSDDPAEGAEVVVMQRLSHDDVSAYLLEQPGVVHLCLPAEYDPERHCSTIIGFNDPRGCNDDGEVLPDAERGKRAGALLWPERFSEKWHRGQEAEVGPYAYAGQYQQIPTPRGGSIIKRDWWRLWNKPKFPDFGTVIVAFDGALADKDIKTNSYNAVTVWGAFPESETNRPKLMLKAAWRMRGPLHDVVARLAATCQEHKADTLLIENKANGAPAASEIQRQYGTRAWTTRLVDVKGDKVARVRAVEPLFAGGLIFAPDTKWAEEVIVEVEQFPRGTHSDYVDTCSLGLFWLRKTGVMLTKQEYDEEELALKQHRRPLPPLYDVYCQPVFRLDARRGWRVSNCPGKRMEAQAITGAALCGPSEFL